MIYKNIYEITNNEDLKINYNWGSVLHGLLMEEIDTKYAEKLHENGIKPFTQFLYYDKICNKNLWVINCLNDESGEKILNKIIEKNFYLKNKNAEINLKKHSSEIVNPEDIINNNFMSLEVNNSNCFNFVTPVAFKKDGHYINYPINFNIFSNLMKKWDTFNEIKTFDQEVLTHISERVYLKKYNLNSKQYYLENTKIPSFTGNIQYGLPISKELKRICNLLCEYSKYSGVGIKTTLGMGGQI